MVDPFLSEVLSECNVAAQVEGGDELGGGEEIFGADKVQEGGLENEMGVCMLFCFSFKMTCQPHPLSWRSEMG